MITKFFNKKLRKKDIKEFERVCFLSSVESLNILVSLLVVTV